MPEFAIQIGLALHLFGDLDEAKLRRKVFLSATPGISISELPGVAYSLTLCHYANFLDRFDRVTCGEERRKSQPNRKSLQVKKVRMRHL
jgi:hypothetical protein